MGDRFSNLSPYLVLVLAQMKQPDYRLWPYYLLGLVWLCALIGAVLHE